MSLTQNLKKLRLWLLSVVLIGAATYLLLPAPEMAVALTALLSAIAGTILYGEERLPLVILSLGLLIVGGVASFKGVIEGMEWVLFVKLAALLTWVDFLSHTRYFDHLIETYLPRQVHGFPLMALLFALAAFSAALIDEVNSIVLWYVVVRAIVGLTEANFFKLKRESWVSFVILLVSATNIGSQFLPLGNPVGIAIAVISGLTALDFIRYAWLPALVTLAYFIARLRLGQRALIEEFKGVTVTKEGFHIPEALHHQYELVEVVEDEAGVEHVVKEERPPLSLLHSLFGIGVIGLVAASPLSNLLNVDSATGLGVFVLGLFAVTLFIATSHGRHTEVMLSALPWNTLFFIVFLFGIAHGLESSGLTDSAAEEIDSLFGQNQIAVRVVIVIVGALVTAFMDNVIAVAVLSPIIIALGERGFDTTGLWFSLLSVAVVAGNLTPIGSTANIIANAKVRSSWGKWWRVGGALALECIIVNQVTLYLWEQVAG
jgi:Na+/H+ antiporter NhaD/arsenite permease-like protein